MKSIFAASVMAKAKKSLGQHFLTVPETARRIAQAVDEDARTIIEVGPGPGILTNELLKRDCQLTFIEKDDEFAAQLAERTAHLNNVNVVNADFLRVDLREVTSDQQTSLVGNFPYNISSQIVFRMLENKELFSEMIGMFQLEMARRIVAGPGSKEYGVISVLTQAYYTGKILMNIAPGQFNPPPKVKSAVIRLERRDNIDLPCSEKWLRKVVKSAFSQRRKMLRNTLKLYLPASELTTDKLYTMRPEQLKLNTFFEIARKAEAFDNDQNEDNDS